MIVLTDIDNDPDDAMSMVRFLTYSNQWEVEGLVPTTSVHLENTVAPDKNEKAHGDLRSYRRETARNYS